MDQTSSSSTYAHLYLGDQHEPTPVYRDLDPKAYEWPEGAVFAVTVNRTELCFPEHWPFPGQESATEFIAEDGWPVGFPEEKKKGYFRNPLGPGYDGNEFYRGLFHRGTPLTWRIWTAEDWEAFRKNYQARGIGCNIYTETKKERTARVGAQVGILRTLRQLLPDPPN